MILETERLTLREMTRDDYPDLAKILQDPAVMYAYEHAFSDEETQSWLDKQIWRYENEGFGLWACVLNSTGEMIGQCGLSMQDAPGGRVVEVGYLFQRAFWHKGYATEAARACVRHAFDVLGIDEVFCIVRDTNAASLAVARRVGLAPRRSFVKHYWGMDMPHILHSIRREEFQK